MFDTVLFDLDGTLTNPFKGITGGVLYALKRLGYALPQRSDLVSFIGPPLFDEFSRSLCFGIFGENVRKLLDKLTFLCYSIYRHCAQGLSLCGITINSVTFLPYN